VACDSVRLAVGDRPELVVVPEEGEKNEAVTDSVQLRENVQLKEGVNVAENSPERVPEGLPLAEADGDEDWEGPVRLGLTVGRLGVKVWEKVREAVPVGEKLTESARDGV